MKKILLTQGKVAIVDDCDYDALIAMGSWCYDRGYATRAENGRNIHMHKMICDRMGYKPKKYLKVRYNLDYRRDVLIPLLDLTPGPKEIFLTQGKIAVVDFEDYEYLMQWNWYYSGRGYAARSDHLKMHRIILERMGHIDFEEVDHINRNKLDNQRCNLRPVSLQQNQCNKGKSDNNTSGYIGVSWNKRAKKWHAQIRVNYKRFHLGYFDNIIKAAEAYNKAARKYRGEFAVLNEI